MLLAMELISDCWQSQNSNGTENGPEFKSQRYLNTLTSGLSSQTPSHLVSLCLNSMFFTGLVATEGPEENFPGPAQLAVGVRVSASSGSGRVLRRCVAGG